MQPRDEQPIERAGKPYDPDRREVATVRLKNGKTKRQYRQMAAGPVRHIKVTPELNAHYVAMTEQKGKSRKQNVRTEPNQANGRASANVIILESRRSRPQRFYVCQQCHPPSLGKRLRVRGLLAADEGEVIA
jgi:hypothetical protein